MDDLDLGLTLKGFGPGQKLFGRYTLQKMLGRGGMGVVWLARDEELERDVALKFLPEVVAMDKEAVRDLKRETRRSLELTHSHIVRIYDFIQDARTAAISMEYIAGETVAARKVDHPAGHFEVAELEGWMRQLLEALTYAHTKGEVVHRDLKPANLMIDARGDLKIADFGIAASVSDSVSRVSAQAGSSGTPVYMSPQQMMGEKPAVTDDLYAFGATLYELLTGKPPFHSGNVMMQVQNKVPPSMTVRRQELEMTGAPIPPAWEQTVAACLAKEAKDRPQSAGEVAARLGLGSSPAVQRSTSNAQRLTSSQTGAAAPPLRTERPAVVASPVQSQTPNPEPKTPNPAPRVAVFIVGVVILVGGLGYYSEVYVPQQNRLAAERKELADAARKAEQMRAAKLQREAELQRERERALAAKTGQEQKDFTSLLAQIEAMPDDAPRAKYEAMNQTVRNYLAGAPERFGPAINAAWVKRQKAIQTLADQITSDLGPEPNAKVVQSLVTANSGDVLAMFSLGYALEKGQGVVTNQPAAARWYRRAAEQGHAAAMNSLGLMHENGRGVAKDLAAANEWYRKAAEKGDPEAMRNLGINHADGIGVAKDQAAAVEWYRKAAEQGHAAAMNSLGLMHENGRGVAKDLAAANEWYRKAAEKGDPEAMRNLGINHAAGIGVAKDQAAAVEWYRKAAEKGHAGAMNSLGDMYENGRGVTKDQAAANEWYRKGAEKGDPSAMYNLGLNYASGLGVAKDGAAAVRWYRKAAEKGHARAMRKVGSAYADGTGVAKDEAAAIDWFRKAAEKGDLFAMNNLGLMYAGGRGVPEDQVMAIEWFRKAAEKGHATAMHNVGVMYEKGDGVTKDQAAANEWFRKAARAGYTRAQEILEERNLTW